MLLDLVYDIQPQQEWKVLGLREGHTVTVGL